MESSSWSAGCRPRLVGPPPNRLKPSGRLGSGVGAWSWWRRWRLVTTAAAPHLPIKTITFELASSSSSSGLPSYTISNHMPPLPWIWWAAAMAPTFLLGSSLSIHVSLDPLLYVSAQEESLWCSVTWVIGGYWEFVIVEVWEELQFRPPLPLHPLVQQGKDGPSQ
jgi:hypothetical protein